MQQKKLLIIANSNIQSVLKPILTRYQTSYAPSGKQAIEALLADKFDLMLLALTLDDMSGYQVSDRLSEIEINQHIPILYLKDKRYEEEIKENIQYCNSCMLTEQYADKMLIEQITHSLSLSTQQTEEDVHQQELNEVTNAMLSLQNDNAKLHDICRFLQKSFFINDVNELSEQLFIITSSFGIKASLYFHTDKNTFFVDSDAQKNQHLSHDIMELAVGGDRIMQFGNDRALFNWQSASLLVDKLTDNVDILAMLMDGFETGLKAIEGINEFHSVLASFRKQNFELSIAVTQVVENLASDIHNELSNSGVQSMLTIEQEDNLNKIADEHRQQVDHLFQSGVKLDQKLETIITELRTATVDEADEIASGEDEIDFF